MQRFQLLLVLVFVADGSLSRGDEGRRRDGSVVAGKLALDGDFFRFVGEGRNEPVGNLHVVSRNPVAGIVRECPWMIRLVCGDSFPVWPLELSAKELRVRTPWVDELRIPRSAIERLEQLPGRHVVGVSGETNSLAMPIPDVSAGWLALRAPMIKTTGNKLSLELGFVRDAKPAPVSVEIAGPNARLNVVAAEAGDVVGAINRDGQPHRITVTFDRETLRVVVDGYVLWSRDRPPGVLREVRIVGAGEGAPRVDQLVVWRASKSNKQIPSANASRDRVSTIEAGEIYGPLTRFDTSGIAMEMRGNPLSLPWNRVVAFDFAPSSAGVEQPTIGEHAEITGKFAGQAESRLIGLIRTWNDKTVEMTHPRLGKLVLPAEWVTEIRPLFYGKRLPVMPNTHHLGTREMAAFRVPVAEGTAVRQFVEMTDTLSGAELVVEARTTRGPSMLRVSLNGETLGKIRIDGDDPVSYRLQLPPYDRKGRVEWELKQEAEPKPGEVELRRVRLEIARPRVSEKKTKAE